MKSKRALSLIIIIGIGALSYSMICVNQKKENRFVESILVIKFLDYKTYPHSIDESMFWANPEYEFAKMHLDVEDGNSFLEEVKNLKKIKMGLSENFDYAFLLRSNSKTDTVYASLARNLWTIKEKNRFNYYEDTEGKLKKFLQNYSSFFSECW